MGRDEWSTDLVLMAITMIPTSFSSSSPSDDDDVPTGKIRFRTINVVVVVHYTFLLAY